MRAATRERRWRPNNGGSTSRYPDTPNNFSRRYRDADYSDESPYAHSWRDSFGRHQRERELSYDQGWYGGPHRFYPERPQGRAARHRALENRGLENPLWNNWDNRASWDYETQKREKERERRPLPRVHRGQTHEEYEHAFEIRQQIEQDRRQFAEHYPDRQFDTVLAQEENLGFRAYPFIAAVGSLRREIVFVPGMDDEDLLCEIQRAFEDIPLGRVLGLRPLTRARVFSLSELCERSEEITNYSRRVMMVVMDYPRQEVQQEDEAEQSEPGLSEDLDNTEQWEGQGLNAGSEEFFMTQAEASAIEELLAAKTPTVQQAYEVYPHLTVLVNAFVRIIRLLTVDDAAEGQEVRPQQRQGRSETSEGQGPARPEDEISPDDEFINIVISTVQWMAKKEMINAEQETQLTHLAKSRHPTILAERDSATSLRELIQLLLKLTKTQNTAEVGGQPISSGILHSVYEKLTDEEVSGEVMDTIYALMAESDPHVLQAIRDYETHKNWSKLLAAFEQIVQDRKKHPDTRNLNSKKSQMYDELKNQILAVRSRVLNHKKLLEEKQLGNKLLNARQRLASLEGKDVTQAGDEVTELDSELGRIRQQLEDLDSLLQSQLSQLDSAVLPPVLGENSTDADVDGLRNLMRLVSQDPDVSVEDAQCVKTMIEDMHPPFLEAFFSFQEHNDYDQYKRKLRVLIRERSAQAKRDPEPTASRENESKDVNDEAFAEKVLQLLHEGQLLQDKERELLLRLVRDKDPAIMNALRQMNLTNDYTSLYTTLLTRAFAEMDQPTTEEPGQGWVAQDVEEGEGDNEGDEEEQ